MLLLGSDKLHVGDMVQLYDDLIKRGCTPLKEHAILLAQRCRPSQQILFLSLLQSHECFHPLDPTIFTPTAKNQLVLLLKYLLFDLDLFPTFDQMKLIFGMCSVPKMEKTLLRPLTKCVEKCAQMVHISSQETFDSIVLLLLQGSYPQITVRCICRLHRKFHSRFRLELNPDMVFSLWRPRSYFRVVQLMARHGEGIRKKAESVLGGIIYQWLLRKKRMKNFDAIFFSLVNNFCISELAIPETFVYMHDTSSGKIYDWHSDEEKLELLLNFQKRFNTWVFNSRITVKSILSSNLGKEEYVLDVVLSFLMLPSLTCKPHHCTFWDAKLCEKARQMRLNYLG